MNKMIQK